MQPFLRLRQLSALAALLIATGGLLSAVPVVERLVVERNRSPDDLVDDPQADNFTTVIRWVHPGYHTKAHFADGPELRLERWSDRAKPITRPACGRGLFLVAQPGVVATWNDRFGVLYDRQSGPGMRVALVNHTDAAQTFFAIDGELLIAQQALDHQGKWKRIETLPSVDCPSSSFRATLAPNSYWEFGTPRYRGSFVTKLRLAMHLGDGRMLYSNTFEGSIDLKQLPKKRPRSREGLPDLWNEW